jgi:membrane-bound ClpP family serine protease
MRSLIIAQAAADATLAGEGEGRDVLLLWGFVLFAVALALLVVELFVPSGGLIGVLCGACAVGSLIMFFRYDTTWGFAVAVAYVILTPVAAVFIFKLWLNSPLARVMILGGTPGGDDAAAAERESEEQRRHRLEALRALIGAEGVAETALRHVGTVRIGGERIDGLAESGIIAAGTPIVVTDVYDNQIKVRPR